MNTFDRVYQLHAMLHARRYPITMRELEERMECSQPTVKRVIAKLRHEMAAPIRYVKAQNGYILDRTDAEHYELPGLWFSLGELQALLTVHELLRSMQPGLLRQELTLFRQRIESILQNNHVATGEIFRRFRFHSVGTRTCLPENFQTTVAATLQRRKLTLCYHNRVNDSADYTSEDYIGMVTNTSSYSGYELSFNTGYQLRRRRMADRSRKSEDIDYSLFFIRLIAGLRASEAR